MNPFQKLRRAVDKATLNYQIDGPPDTPKLQPAQPAVESFQKTTMKVGGNEASSGVGPLLLQQQTKFIQQINQLSLKNERLTRSLKTMEIEKQQYIQKICVLEKNNDVLEEKIRELHTTSGDICDKERRFQEQIYRINKTVEMLGKQINQERNMKKNIVAEFSRFREDTAATSQQDERIREDLQAQIRRMQEQLKQRSGLLEYNILKNSQERKESRILLERTNQIHDERTKELTNIISSLKDQLAMLKTNFQVLTHKHEIVLQKCEDLQRQNSQASQELSQVKTKNKDLEVNLRQTSTKIQQLAGEKSQLEARLKEAKENVRIKVVEIKDESLQLELEMYKRQCKELLQERAVLQRMNSDGVSYQIVK